MFHGVNNPLVEAYIENKSSYECRSQHITFNYMSPKKPWFVRVCYFEFVLRHAITYIIEGAFRFGTMHGNFVHVGR